MHLTSAKCLSERMPSSEIALNKTRTLIGETVDFNGLEGENEDLTEVLDGSAHRRRLLKRHLLEQSKPFREFEALIQALDLIETVRSVEVIMVEEQYVDRSSPNSTIIDLSRGQFNKWDPQARKQFAQLYENEEAIMQPLFNQWLLSCPNGMLCSYSDKFV